MKKHSRKKLLAMIGELQNLIGLAQMQFNDRNPNRADDVMNALQKAHYLCIEARSTDPPP